jgi:hypothetical protein
VAECIPRIGGNMKKIPVNCKGFTYEMLVDSEDYDFLSRFTWYGANTSGKVRPYTTLYYRHFTPYKLLMAIKGAEIDHVDNNPLNNQKNNLRWVTHRENCYNMPDKKKQMYSDYRGVTFDKERGKWMAKIRVGGATKNLGRFDTEIEAAKAYNEASLKYHGEYGRLNAFPA